MVDCFESHLCHFMHKRTLSDDENCRHLAEEWLYWEGRSDVIKRWYNFIVNIHNLGNVQDMYM